MTTFAVDDPASIAARLREIRREEGRPDDDWRSAIGIDLDGIAAGVGLVRRGSEGDRDLRARVGVEVER